MSGWRGASVPKFNWIRGQASSPDWDQRDAPFQELTGGFHHDATLTLSPRLTTAVAAIIIAASTVSLGMGVTFVIWSIRTVIAMPA
ncbi:hypothetical protein [Bradyrhizobium sp. STM 3809]|uniref:hypothetical protein n=1 Tax=Bradyrhizobium sp. STM 3809 TaxID=551936 RepID=UPI0002408160|nr:hypothetical protein [Bradyrhizobium sp. STM 3809]CCD98385.1 conserved hypothetical protein [Bradyrhizobium sp. STM 3809]